MVAFHRDGARLVTAGADGAARLWPLAEDACPGYVLRQEHQVGATAFAREVPRLVTITGPRAVRGPDVGACVLRTLR